MKRALDIAGAGLLLLLMSPAVAMAALALRITMGPGVLFRQWRGGLHGKPFTLYKLRTMTEQRDAGGALLPDAQRITAVGRLVRRTSLDELPQLWNVLKGEMSLVGPRPLLATYLPCYNAFQRRRHEVKPGLTGWVQVNGRNDLDWNEKFALDVWYVDHRSLSLDLRILFLTTLRVIGARGVSRTDHATMPEFFGENTGVDGAATRPTA